MAVASSPNPKASGSAPTKEKKRKMLDSSVEEDATKSDKKAIVSGSQPKKRNSNPGVRVIHGRVYDSENGTTCHQCRQKTYAVFVTCKNKAKAKPCPIKYCNTCLLNRYGEKVEEVTLLDEWNCPRCRGACNCSICRKKRGHEPTGMLTQMAKAGGFSSVSNMLDVKGDQIVSNYKRVKETCASPRKKVTSEEGIVITSPKKKGKENLFDGKTDSNANPSVPVSSPVDEKPKKSNQKKPKPEESKETISENGKNDAIKPKKSNQKKLKTDLSNDMVVENGNNDAIKPKKTSQKKLKTEGLKETTVGNANEIKPKKVNQKKLKPEGSKETIVENGKNDAIKPKKIIQKKLKLQVSNEIGVENAVLKVNGGQKKQKGTKKTNENKVEDKNTSDENKDQNALKLSTKSSDIVTPLPTGSELLTIGGVDLPKEDVGNALQFLEFCATFGKILDVKKGHAEAVLRDLIKVRSTRRGKCSVAIQFHIQLLSVIQSESESESELESESVLTHRNDSWLKGLKSCIPKSYLSEKIDLIDGKSGGYDCLDSSTKLRLLTFLCDEVLETEKIRNWIDDQNAKFNEKKKEARSKLSDAREKEKSLKQKMQDDIAKAIIDRDGAPLTLMEHDAIISKIKKQTAEAHAEMLACKQMLPIDQERPDAVRIEPVFKDSDGHFYWRLKGCTDKPGILLQDIGNGDLDLSADKWSYYNDEEMDLIEKHIRVMRSRMVQKRL